LVSHQGSMKTRYTAKVIARGGRNGSVQSPDKRFRMAIRPPPEMGGDEEDSGTNPEELFAAAYGSCFRSALEQAARAARISLKDSTLTTVVNLKETNEGGQQLGVELRADLPGVDRTTAERLLEQAHRTCPYSKALRGNAEVKLALAKTGRVRAKRQLVSFGR
jgi:lipoyl-dependent peroxiredoxin